MLATIPWIHGWTYLIYWCYSKHDFEIITVSDFCFIWILKQEFVFFIFLEKVKTDNPITTSGLNLVARLCSMFSCCLKSSFFDNTVWVWWPRNTWRAYFICFRKISTSRWRVCFANCSSDTLFLVSKIQISLLLTWLVLCPASLGWALKVIKHWLEWRVMVERNGRPNCLPI